MRRAWLLLVLWLAGGTALAQPGELAVRGADHYVLSKSFVFLEDKDGKLTIDDVQKPALQSLFRQVDSSGPGANFGLTRSAIWLKVMLNTTSTSREDWLLEIAYPPLDTFELYSPSSSGFQKQTGGDLYPFSHRAIPHRNHVVPVRLNPGQSNILYLRIQSEGTVAAPATLWQSEALWQHDMEAYAALSLYFGLLIGLFLYNALLFISVREAAYALYVAFAGSMAIGQASLTGLGAQFLWSDLTWWNSVSPPVGLSLAAIFGTLFARDFLSSSVRMPRIDKWLLTILTGWGLAVLAAVALPYTVSSYMVTLLAVVSVVTMVSVGVVSVKREFAGARYFFLAWAVLLVGVLTLALHNTGFLPSNAITSNGLLIGSALEMVLLSFALGDRINVARRFKAQAQARIAAERAMVQALSHSQGHMKSVLEEREIILQNSIVGIAFLTHSGRLRWANRAMLDIFGIEGRPGVSMERLYTSREQYLEIGAVASAALARGEVFESEVQMRRMDGTPIWVFLSGKAVHPEDLHQGTVWVIMNITQRKELEQQLQRTSSEREAILNSALVGIVLSVGGTLEWVNDKFAQMLDYPRQILLGQPFEIIHPDAVAYTKFRNEARTALFATGGSYICEMQLKRKNGELFWVELGGSCIRDAEPDSGVIWTFLDITGRKKSEAEIREALEQQRALNELRSRFVSMTSHEFRTPLAAIMSAEELLRHYGDRLPKAERDEILDSIATGVQRMSRMMDRVLLLGKADAGMLDFVPQRIQLAPLCKQFVDEARAQQPEDRSEVKLSIDDGAEGTYDEKLLRHIFSNLLSNALKYSPGGGEVRFDVRREQTATVFEVSDRGIGIPPEEIAHLFESFHRASNVGAIQGTGLGLAIVKNAVEMHGGAIEVKSKLGEGTTFRVRLPGD
jgi:PAS domain S-box-containing protein